VRAAGKSNRFLIIGAAFRFFCIRSGLVRPAAAVMAGREAPKAAAFTFVSAGYRKPGRSR